MCSGNGRVSCSHTSDRIIGDRAKGEAAGRGLKLPTALLATAAYFQVHCVHAKEELAAFASIRGLFLTQTVLKLDGLVQRTPGKSAR